MQNGQFWESWHESLHSNMAIDDRERFNRVYRASADGMDGSTHWETLNDLTECLCAMDVIDPDDYDDDEVMLSDWDLGWITQADQDEASAEIAEARRYHMEQGTIENEIG